MQLFQLVHMCVDKVAEKTATVIVIGLTSKLWRDEKDVAGSAIQRRSEAMVFTLQCC